MNSTSKKARVLFAQAHGELVSLRGEPEAASLTLGLQRLITELELDLTAVCGPLAAEHLEDSQVLVLGAPKTELNSIEVETILRFVQAGGGLLLVADSSTIISPVDSFNRLAGMVGLQFREYLNYPPTWLQVFSPHYITANVDRVRVKNVAGIFSSNGAYDLAFTKATRTSVAACTMLGDGRVVAVGDVGLFTDELLAVKGNETLVSNVFRWLAFQNAVDVQAVIVPETVKWGQTADVALELFNPNREARPQVECILESDADALISEPARKSRSIPSGKTTHMQWTVKPQILGDQKLRLVIHIEGQPSLYFDQLLPTMLCEAPGYLTLQIRNLDGESETRFLTGDKLVAEGALHWPAGLRLPPCHLDLEYTKGLAELGYQPGEGVGCWHLQACASGEHKLTLRIRETAQSLPAMVTVCPSIEDQLRELQAAYIYPLDAEIAERLRAVDERLSDESVRRKPFKILPSDQYIQEMYSPREALWLKQVLVAARREQWHNLDLLNQVLIYFAPAHVPGWGSFVPYDPALASHLTRLHPTARLRLECNFVRSEESQDISVKQNIAAYLLHEKYGHGFFYARTRLGQQLTILQRHGFPAGPEDEVWRGYAYPAQLIEDSATIVNEGFATWMELTFLEQLDREVRQAVNLRRILLLQEATGLYDRQRDSHFFQTFPPRFDSPYREGFEYLEFISRNFSLQCAVQAFLIATNIDFGITESVDGEIKFEQDAAEIEQRLLVAKEEDACSHIRLCRIAELTSDHQTELQMRLQKQRCPQGCQESCPLAQLVRENMKWRKSYAGKTEV